MELDEGHYIFQTMQRAVHTFTKKKKKDVREMHTLLCEILQKYTETSTFAI